MVDWKPDPSGTSSSPVAEKAHIVNKGALDQKALEGPGERREWSVGNVVLALVLVPAAATMMAGDDVPLTRMLFVLLLLWELGSRSGLIPERTLAAPSAVIDTLAFDGSDLPAYANGQRFLFNQSGKNPCTQQGGY